MCDRSHEYPSDITHLLSSVATTYPGMAGSIDCKSYQFLDARDRDGGRKSLLRGLAKVRTKRRKRKRLRRKRLRTERMRRKRMRTERMTAKES